MKRLSKNQQKNQNPRLAALRALADVLDSSKNLAESTAFLQLQDSRNIALARHLSYEVLRWLSALEWLSARLLSKPLKKRETAIQRLIYLGLQQLWHDQTASHAAINETAECARLLGKPWAVGLINAVLRRFQRESEQLLQKLSQSDQRFAHPPWMLSEIRQSWPQRWQEIVDANNQHAPMWLRINRQRADETKLMTDLKTAGFDVANHVYAADAIAIEPAAAVNKVPGFEKGWLSVQDPAAQLACSLLSPEKGDRILDACAAPGGKAAHLLEACPDIELLANDRQASRVVQIHENLDRLGLKATVKVADSASPEGWWNGKRFNKILLDAPCSASGVIRRHPEIKWLRDQAQIETVNNDQARLLDALWPLLDAGGMLVYATCSIFDCENGKQIQQFLQRHPEAVVEIPAVEWGLAGFFGRQVLPGEALMDGFFYAVLRKPA